MKYNLLGTTGLEVSRMSLGTVELGMDYGIRKNGKSNVPDKETAFRILKHAIDNGINLFDSAPNYGISEKLLGESIGNQSDCYIATKVSAPLLKDRVLTVNELREKLNASLDRSRFLLRREVLDIVQIHNATEEILHQGEITEILLRAQDKGKIRFLGVSVYGVENALAAINSGCFDVIQVAYSMLDQRMDKEVFPLAKLSQVGIINRSVFLKGVLTKRASWLSGELDALKQSSELIVKSFNISWDQLSSKALRFCLSSEFVDTLLIGVNTVEELEHALNSVSEGPMNDETLKMAYGFALSDERLLNPACWSVQ